jgi:short-subunit dehydrogenase
MDYSRAVVLVTGASSGIGYETALAFAARGARVVGVARREDRLRELVAACNRTAPLASFLAGDLADPAFAERIVRDTVERHGRIDVLVNNAGMPKHKQIYDLSPQEAEHVLRVNFLSAVWTTLAAIPPMLAQREGVIVNVSSFAALVCPPRETIYAASKAALNAWSAGLWNDLAGSGVHVGLVNPGAIETEIWGKLDEPPAFAGRKHPPSLVVDAIFECVEKRRHERTVPRRSLSLFGARLLRRLAPGLLRRGMARFEPVPAEVIENARARAREASIANRSR